jgi:hypothetical protein
MDQVGKALNYRAVNYQKGPKRGQKEAKNPQKGGQKKGFFDFSSFFGVKTLTGKGGLLRMG